MTKLDKWVPIDHGPSLENRGNKSFSFWVLSEENLQHETSYKRDQTPILESSFIGLSKYYYDNKSTALQQLAESKL